MHPILSALKHHKVTVALVVLEIALTCAIITNALFLIGDRTLAMRAVTGVADDSLLWVRATGLDLGQESGPEADVAADLAALRGWPGVESVARVNALPLAGNYSSLAVWRQPGAKADMLSNVVEYLGTPGMLRTLGIRLAAGRDFTPQEHVDYNPFEDQRPPTVAVISRTLGEQLWPGADPLGKTFWLDSAGEQPVQVVGVVDQLLNPSINRYQGADRNLILPVTGVAGGIYALRVPPDQRARIARDLPGVLARINPARMVKANIYTDTVSDYYHGDRAMVWLLLVVVACLLAVTALGVVGLGSFWVQQRTRQIGVRRAVGATRRDILRYFQVENLLIVGIGIALGLLGAVALNLWLMQHYELPRLPLWYLPIGALALWVLGQLAVLGPALRAARVPPVVATRSV